MSGDGLSCGRLVAVDGYRAAGERHLRHVTMGDSRRSRPQRLQATCLQKRIFNAQTVAKWRAVYWMTAALVAPAMNAVFFIIPPSVGILLNLARPFTACISSALPSTGRIAEEAQTQRAM